MFGLDFIKKKLDIMSGVLNTVEGIAKKISQKLFLTDVTVTATRKKVEEIYELLKKSVEEDHRDFYFSKFQIDDAVFEGRITKITMNEFQQVSGSYAAEKQDGSPAKVQNPRLETDRPDVLTGELDAENQRVTFKAVRGSVQEDTAVAVKVIADADLGEGVEEIEVVGSVLVSPGRAKKLTLQLDEPVDQEL